MDRSDSALRAESVVSDPSEVLSGPLDDLQVNLRLAQQFSQHFRIE
jgi:hypothetical protein